MSLRHFYLPLLLIVILLACRNRQDTSTETQIHILPFTNTVADNEELNILNYLYFYNGAGVAVGNVVGDSLPDIYLVSNLGNNKLFENKGSFTFEEVGEQAGVQGKATWQTGTAMADINNDGLLDIFVCAVSGIHNFTGHNEVYINQGDGTFKEQAAHLGLNQQDYSTAVSFLDYDNDGDLDVYLLNHAVHTEDGYRLKAENVRNQRSQKVGDRLLRNEQHQFFDVSEKAGILGGKVNYGLAVRVADFNEDNWPDLYVSNDFHENDYLYLNKGNGHFAQIAEKLFAYTTRFSMGNDVADVNNDGTADLFVADMQPFEWTVLKKSPPEDASEIFSYKLKHGYHRQYARNTLQLNKGNTMQDVAQLVGVSATDWSWSPLFADFNLDGKQDLFVSNGIWRRPNDLDYLKYISTQEIAKQLAKGTENDLSIIEQMPQGLVPNFMFYQAEKGIQHQPFQDVSQTVGFTENDSSNGAALGDLDGDGDLDLVINRLNAPSIIWENNTKGHFIQLSVINKQGIDVIGARVTASQNKLKQTAYTNFQKGFMSSSQPLINFGFPTTDSVVLETYWPNGEITKNTVAVNQHLQLVMPSKKQDQLPIADTSWLSLPSQQIDYQAQKFKGNNLLPYAHYGQNKTLFASSKTLNATAQPWNEVIIIQNGQQRTTNSPNGFWLNLTWFDKDDDGDLDLLCGNLGENTRLRASQAFPMTIYKNDLDQNGTEDIIWTMAVDSTYYPILWKDQLSKQLPFLNKQYQTYSDFAHQTVEELFGKSLQNASRNEINSLQNGWLINEGDTFSWQPLPFFMQAGPITTTEIKNNELYVWGKYDGFIPTVGLTTLQKHRYKTGMWIHD